MQDMPETPHPPVGASLFAIEMGIRVSSRASSLLPSSLQNILAKVDTLSKITFH